MGRVTFGVSVPEELYEQVEAAIPAVAKRSPMVVHWLMLGLYLDTAVDERWSYNPFDPTDPRMNRAVVDQIVADAWKRERRRTVRDIREDATREE